MSSSSRWKLYFHNHGVLCAWGLIDPVLYNHHHPHKTHHYCTTTMQCHPPNCSSGGRSRMNSSCGGGGLGCNMRVAWHSPLLISLSRSDVHLMNLYHQIHAKDKILYFHLVLHQTLSPDYLLCIFEPSSINT